jgi:hypothetical protein
MASGVTVLMAGEETNIFDILSKSFLTCYSKTLSFLYFLYLFSLRYGLKSESELSGLYFD